MHATFWITWAVVGIVTWWLFVRYISKQLTWLNVIYIPFFVYLGWFWAIPLIVVLFGYIVGWIETSKRLRKPFKSWE